MHKRLLILGTHGLPAQHGGFETVAEELALHLVQKNWRITVYCREPWERTSIYETMWGRVRRVHIPVKQKGWLGSFIFSWKAARHARTQPTLSLHFGYKHAITSLLQVVRKKSVVFHMGGMPYLTPGLSTLQKMAWLISERVARFTGSHFITDHPLMEQQLKKHKLNKDVSLIVNGALDVVDASTAPVQELGLEPGKYSLMVAVPSPERSTLEVVKGFSREARGHTLVVMGDLDENNPYHQQVLDAASDEVLFLEANYDKDTLRALRYHCYLSVNGQQLGGTNPSIIEALAAGNPILAHDNAFNRWTVGSDAGVFFSDADSCAAQFDTLLAKPDLALAMKKAARLRHADAFTLAPMLKEYEKILNRHNPYAPDPEGWEQYLDE